MKNREKLSTLFQKRKKRLLKELLATMEKNSRDQVGIFSFTFSYQEAPISSILIIKKYAASN